MAGAEKGRRRARALRWAGVAGAWAAVGVFFTPQTWLAYAYSPRRAGWAEAFAASMLDAGLWAALTPGIAALGRLAPFGLRRLWIAAPTHLAAGLAAAAVQTAAFQAIVALTAIAPVRQMLPVEMGFKVLTYGAVLAFAGALAAQRRHRERETAAARLEGLLARARLDLLEMQLRPHFLFNALNALSELIHEDPERADRMVAHLSGLLRASMARDSAHEVPLEEEMEILSRYLAVEQTRFQDRLTVEIDLPFEVRGALVPRLILQPIVENAIRHGVARRRGPGRVAVRAARDGARLRIEVSDDGPGLVPAPEEAREGIGLSTTRERLRGMYGDDHAFDLGEAPGGGVRVVLSVPLRIGGAPEPRA
jgi:signal transduction histidine kinase